MDPRSSLFYDYVIELINHYVNNVLTDNSITSTALTDRWVIQISVNVTEPLLPPKQLTSVGVAVTAIAEG